MTLPGVSVAEGYWPGTIAGDGREVVTHRFIPGVDPAEALRMAGADEPRTVWYMAYAAEDMADLRQQREREFVRAGGARP
jgi:hypothetical protein